MKRELIGVGVKCSDGGNCDACEGSGVDNSGFILHKVGFSVSVAMTDEWGLLGDKCG